MKKTHSYLILLLLLSLMVGCKKEANTLTITKEKVCLQFNQSEQCAEGAGTFRLHLVEGKPVLEAMAVTKLQGTLTYPQYGRPDAVKTEKLGVIIENRVLSLQDGERKLMDSTGLGFLLIRDAAGNLTVSSGESPEHGPTIYHLDGREAIAAGAPKRIQLMADLSDPKFMALKLIKYAISDAANHYVPNDTGTEVVIIDNFHVVGDCSAEAPAECCKEVDPLSPPVVVTEDFANGYAQDGLKLLACFPVNSICTFTAGDKLIVIDCITQKRYCLDYSLCPVTITAIEGYGICISVPQDCSIENPFL